MGLWGRSQLPTLKGVEGRARSPGISLGRDQAIWSRTCIQTNTSWLEFILHAFGVGTSHGLTRTHMTHHGPGSGDVITILPIVFFALLRHTHTQVVVCPGTPKVESRNCLGFGFLGLWGIVTSRLDLRSGRGLNQTCSPLPELSNALSHSRFGYREKVDSRLLVVGSQTGSLTLGFSFAHNLGCRCPNDQCEAISDIYTSRPFQ